jgi:AcrR family transcriptional regulator
MTQKEQSLNQCILHAAGTLFHETGYGQVSVDDIARKAQIDPSFIYSEYSDKSGLCHAWLVSLHQHSESRHREILESTAAPIEKVRDYFDHLSEWMSESGFAGCPFTRTVNSLGTGDSPNLRNEVKQHKEFVADFFITLAREIARNQKQAERLGRQLFLLNSAATTESKNLEALWPIDRAREIALEICEAAKDGKHINFSQAQSAME